MRPDWDTYFMRITKLVATRSSCLRRSVGAVLVKDKRILATGYNGAPACRHGALRGGGVSEGSTAYPFRRASRALPRLARRAKCDNSGGETRNGNQRQHPLLYDGALLTMRENAY